MPNQLKTKCRSPLCPALVSPQDGWCATHKKVEQQSADQKRGTAHQRGYTTRWTKARTGYLRAHPLCVECQNAGRITPATVVDHIIPHKGDHDLFWDAETNWQPLCKPHHDAKTARDDGGFGRRRSP